LELEYNYKRATKNKTTKKMKNVNWIPKQNELVKHKDKLYKVVCMKFSGSCTLKEVETQKVIKDININNLQRLEK
jgi:hypothetical protein